MLHWLGHVWCERVAPFLFPSFASSFPPVPLLLPPLLLLLLSSLPPSLSQVSSKDRIDDYEKCYCLLITVMLIEVLLCMSWIYRTYEFHKTSDCKTMYQLRKNQVCPKTPIKLKACLIHDSWQSTKKNYGKIFLETECSIYIRNHHTWEECFVWLENL